MPPPDDHVDTSDEDLSPPPDEPNSPSVQVAQDFAAQHQNSISVAPATHPHVAAPPEKIRKKPGRKPGWNKPKDLDANGAAVMGEASSTPDGPKKRARKPKDPNAPPLPRGRKKKAESLDGPASLAMAQARPDLQPRPPAAELMQPPTTAESGQNEGIHRPLQSFFAPAPPAAQQQSPAPQTLRSSGQNYDPIRSNYDPIRETTVIQSNPFSTQGSPKPVPLMNRASASPSISSLVDPPHHPPASPSVATQSFFNQQVRNRDEKHQSLPASPSFARATEPLPSPTVMIAAPPSKIVQSNGNPTPVDSEAITSVTGTASAVKKTNASSSTPQTSGSSPKAKPKDKDKDTAIFPAPPPLPGSGLMQGGSSEYRAPTVILSIPMNGGEVNKYVNFTRLAEEQYGWDALHPRLAAQRDRLARVAAAGAALERNGDKDSGDDMSLDSDAEGDNSNIEMGGMSDGRTGTDAGGKKVPKKRKLKEDEYDKDDGFVDDSDLLWEEQAAAANDGFFVYSGPLVPEAEKPVNDIRGDGVSKRGRGGRGRGGSKLGTNGRASAPKAVRDGNLPTTGPGSRGGSINRKPRITKADRARMEQEKEERERMGAASMSLQTNGYGGMIPLGSGLGSTPMVFNQN